MKARNTVSPATQEPETGFLSICQFFLLLKSGYNMCTGWRSTMEQYLNQFLESLKAEQGRADNTIAAYRNDLTQFITFIRSRLLDPVEPANVTPELLDAYVGDLQVGSG